MDVDSTQHTRNSPLISYFDVTNQFPWQEPRAEQIRHRRTLLYNTLIFDILLTSGGIREPYLLFPPEDVESLQKLLDAIQNSTYDTLKKDCLVYFLLKWHQDGREKGFQQQRCIPPQFAALADAYWHLDTGINVPRAVAILSDCRLNKDHTSKIMVALSIAPDSDALIRRYVQTAKPSLVEPLDLEMYTLALADFSVLNAWKYTRTFSESDEMRPRLLKKVLDWAVTPNPRTAALTQLVSLPLSIFEESVLNDFVQNPPPELKFSAVAVLQDLICVRLIQGGRYNEAIKLDRQFTSTTSPKNLKRTHDRTKMVHDVYGALPSVERALLDLELDPGSPTKPPLVPKNVSLERCKAVPQEPQDSPLSQSWEDVRMPDALVNKSTPLREVRVPSSTPVSMPRFGGSSLQTPTAAPILPVNNNSLASTSALTPRKSLPLTASVLGSSQARTSMGGVGTRMRFTGNAAIASPASGIKFSKATTASSPGPGNGFVSATRQQNAFYQPPTTKTNGVKRPFEETTQSPERPNISANDDADIVVAVEKETDRPEWSSRRSQKSRAGEPKDRDKEQEAEREDENVLQFSVFKGRDDHSSPEPPSRRKAIPKSPPGSYVSEDDDAMDEDHDERKKTTRSRVSRPTRSSKSQAISKPPAKKARQLKDGGTRMNIPGSLMDDDDELEEEDYVTPLRAPSPPRRAVRKARSSVSADVEEEGIQTRRRSSRLITGIAHGSAHSGSPEPPTTARTKKGTRSGAKKKR